MLSLCNLFTELYKVRQESDRQQGLPKNFLPRRGACHFLRRKKLKKNFGATCIALQRTAALNFVTEKLIQGDSSNQLFT